MRYGYHTDVRSLTPRDGYSTRAGALALLMHVPASRLVQRGGALAARAEARCGGGGSGGGGGGGGHVRLPSTLPAALTRTASPQGAAAAPRAVRRVSSDCEFD